MAWDLVCKPKTYGDLGLREIRSFQNKAFIAKHNGMWFIKKIVFGSSGFMIISEIGLLVGVSACMG